MDGLSACRADAGRRLVIDPTRPLNVFVHGWRATAGRFRTLADVFQAHDQQSVCFSYNSRHSIEANSASLTTALLELEKHIQPHLITVFGHSNGGLIARRALSRNRQDGLSRLLRSPYRLVTVASPFNGIRAASQCGEVWLHAATLAFSALACQVVAGDMWDEIHASSHHVTEPDPLVRQVREHLLVVTLERDHCYQEDVNGECLRYDFMFEPEEQLNPRITRDSRVRSVRVDAGHSGVLGDDNVVPVALMNALRAEGVLQLPAPKERPVVASSIQQICDDDEPTPDPVLRRAKSPEILPF